ncbi:unnamed protein product, partial [marine sediment metagenome]
FEQGRPYSELAQFQQLIGGGYGGSSVSESFSEGGNQGGVASRLGGALAGYSLGGQVGGMMGLTGTAATMAGPLGALAGLMLFS